MNFQKPYIAILLVAFVASCSTSVPEEKIPKKELNNKVKKTEEFLIKDNAEVNSEFEIINGDKRVLSYSHCFYPKNCLDCGSCYRMFFLIDMSSYKVSVKGLLEAPFSSEELKDLKGDFHVEKLTNGCDLIVKSPITVKREIEYYLDCPEEERNYASNYNLVTDTVIDEELTSNDTMYTFRKVVGHEIINGVKHSRVIKYTASIQVKGTVEDTIMKPGLYKFRFVYNEKQ